MTSKWKSRLLNCSVSFQSIFNPWKSGRSETCLLLDMLATSAFLGIWCAAWRLSSMFPIFHYSYGELGGFHIYKLFFFYLWLVVRIGKGLFQKAVNADLVYANTSAWPFKKNYQTNCVVLLLDEKSETSLNIQFPGNSIAWLTVQVRLCCLNLQLGLTRSWWRWGVCVKRLRKVELFICVSWLVSYLWLHSGLCIYKVLQTVGNLLNCLTFLWTTLTAPPIIQNKMYK